MKNELISNATEFCTITSSELIANPALGHGTDGSVWRTSRGTAVKSFFYEKNYRDELECYLRLMKYEISEICGLAVPTYEDSSDSLLTLEMSIVQHCAEAVFARFRKGLYRRTTTLFWRQATYGKLVCRG